ncbi:MAG: preprotein translocase subunit SecG [Alphaproteobacteria bacterium]
MTVLITLHALITLALIVVVLMQKRNTGALGGLAGQSNPSRMMTPRASSNPLAKLTTWLAAVFIGLSLILAYVSKGQKDDPTEALSQAVKASTLPLEGTPAVPSSAAPSPAPAKTLQPDLETPAKTSDTKPSEATSKPASAPQPHPSSSPAP